MKRKMTKPQAPQIRLVGWGESMTAVAAVAGLASGFAVAAPGDLDPSFGDVGRKSDISLPWTASMRSVELQDDDTILYGAGGEYDYYDWYEDIFGRLLPDGTTDGTFVPASLERVALYDSAVQSDGKLVGVGLVRQADGRQKLAVFRLLRDGALDAGFGLNGLLVISDGASSREAAYSVVVDPDGRIVIAGERNNMLLVTRLLPNGALDTSFGSGGIVTGNETLRGTQRIARTPSGGYRVIATFASGGMGWRCQIAALTPAGTFDATFDTDGYAYPPSDTNASAICSSLVVQSDGRTVVAGSRDDGVVFLDRLMPNGAAEPGFDGSAAGDRFQTVSALGLGPTGRFYVAGTDASGFSSALVTRLLPDGTVDPAYGKSGTTFVDPRIRLGQGATISDLTVLSDGGLLVAGTHYHWLGNPAGFVAKLRGDGAGGSPGVFSIAEKRAFGTEGSSGAVLSVRRAGGSNGAVAVSYSTSLMPWTDTSGGGSYSPGENAATNDFTATAGRLTWADGDTTDREIIVPLTADSAIERPEWFGVELSAPEGGAGLGSWGAVVEIAGDSYPHGDFVLYGPADVREGETASFTVMRNFYAEGEVSVTVRVAAGGTATAGDDFRTFGSSGWQDVVLSWADGELGGKFVQVTIVADGTSESTETFTLEIVSPTSGALIGAPMQAVTRIGGQTTAPAPTPSPVKRNGGGAFEWIGAMLLALAGVALRRSRRQHEVVRNA